MHTAKFYLEIGRFIAGPVERELKRAAFSWDIKIDIQKEMGLLEGIMLVTVKGPNQKTADKFCDEVKKYVSQYNS
jgi:hypothetical protein